MNPFLVFFFFFFENLFCFIPITPPPCLETNKTPGEEYQIEYMLRRADGVFKWFLALAAPVRNEQNVIIKWFGTLTDIGISLL